MTGRLKLALPMLAGGLALVALIGWIGFAEIGTELGRVGWGLGLVALLHLVPMTCSAFGWRALHRGLFQAPWHLYVRLRWVRESINSLLPLGQIGGELIGTRLIAKHGAQLSLAGAGCIVDLTMEVIAQFVFSLVGVSLLIAWHGYDGTVSWVIIGASMAAPILIGFVLAQRWGLFRLVERGLEKLAAWLGIAALAGLAGLHDMIAAMHRNGRNLGMSFFWHFASWVVGAGEIWLAFHLLGVQAGFAEAVILESLVQAVRSAAFVVPGGLGVQEGGYVLLGSLLGLSPELALSLALVKRVRELLIGLPGLVAWQIEESRWLMRARAENAPGE